MIAGNNLVQFSGIEPVGFMERTNGNYLDDFVQIAGQAVIGLQTAQKDYLPSIEPTPIDITSAVVVDELPLLATESFSLWQGNNLRFIDSLKNVLAHEEVQGIQGKLRRNLVGTPSSHLWSTAHKKPPKRSLGSGHSEQWKQRFDELVEFREEFGHCLVPLKWKRNPSLAHWVKRQRYQYRIKGEGKNSSMNKERQEKLGFIWDSHAAGWQERWDELQQFKEQYGHCNVPKTYDENPQLAVWVKCQRRQFKLFTKGEKSNMTLERIEKLSALGFLFNPRLKKKPLFFKI